jgi:hypothetical protein
VNLAAYHNSLWRVVLPVLCAIAAIAAIEILLQFTFHPTFWQKTQWRLYDPFHGEFFDRDEMAIRLSHLQDSEPDIISVGDSSGFFSLQSTVINRYLDGQKFLSLNTGANQAFLGYQSIAEYMLQRSGKTKYVILYIFPQYLPQEEIIDPASLGPITYEDLVGARSYLTPPSAFLSPYAKAGVFLEQRFHAGLPLSNHMPALQLIDTVNDALGWMPEFDVRSIRYAPHSRFYSDERSGWFQHLGQRLGLADPSSINAHLDVFDRTVRRYGAHLAIAFAPMPRHLKQALDPNYAVAVQAFERFQREHPDVKFLFPFLTEWGAEKFGAINHISREYTFLASERLGKALARLLRDPDSFPPFTAPAEAPPYSPVAATPAGPEDPSLLEPALALYLYASTADEKYRALFSSRVAGLLAREPAFQYAMADEHARAISQAERAVKIGFDLSQMRARPITLTGMLHCNADQTVQWVQVYGSMIFTFQSPTAYSTAAVAWPMPSNIFMPTVVENSVRRFDGYCPEPSLEEAASTQH